MKPWIALALLVPSLSLAAGTGGTVLTAEQARKIVAARLGDEALPRGEDLHWRVEESGDEAVLLAERVQLAASFRFRRTEDRWVLAGLDLSDDGSPPVSPSAEAPPAAAAAPAPTTRPVSVELVPEGFRMEGVQHRLGTAGESVAAITRALALGGTSRALVEAAERHGDDEALTALLRELRLAGAEQVDIRFHGDPPARTEPPPPTIPASTPTDAEAEAVTRDVLSRLGNALSRLKRSEGAFPSAPEGSTVAEMDDRRGFLSPFYMRKVPEEDGWGRSILYTANRTGTRYELRSAGVDGVLGNGDDLVLANGRFRQGSAGETSQGSD